MTIKKKKISINKFSNYSYFLQIFLAFKYLFLEK
jgi:hypothetical protein